MVRNDCRKFRSNHTDSFFARTTKSRKMAVIWPILGHLWLCFSDPSHTILMSLYT